MSARMPSIASAPASSISRLYGDGALRIGEWGGPVQPGKRPLEPGERRRFSPGSPALGRRAVGLAVPSKFMASPSFNHCGTPRAPRLRTSAWANSCASTRSNSRGSSIAPSTGTRIVHRRHRPPTPSTGSRPGTAPAYRGRPSSPSAGYALNADPDPRIRRLEPSAPPSAASSASAGPSKSTVKWSPSLRREPIVQRRPLRHASSLVWQHLVIGAARAPPRTSDRGVEITGAIEHVPEEQRRRRQSRLAIRRPRPDPCAPVSLCPS